MGLPGKYKTLTATKGQLAELAQLAHLAEPHWTGIPKVVGSIPTVTRDIFQACPLWIYTQGYSFSCGKLSMDWNGQENFLCLVSSGLDLMTLTQRKSFCPFQSTDNFPEWKLAFRVTSQAATKYVINSITRPEWQI